MGILEFAGHRRHGLVAGVHPDADRNPGADTLEQSLVRWNERYKRIALPVRETEDRDHREGNHDEDGDDRTHGPDILDAAKVDVRKADDDRRLEKIFLNRCQVDDAGRIRPGKYDIDRIVEIDGDGPPPAGLEAPEFSAGALHPLVKAAFFRNRGPEFRCH